MLELCKEYEISRKTGYKLWNRYRERGIAALEDASRRPNRLARKTPVETEELILKLKREHMTWGSTKLREMLLADHPDVRPPARSTIDGILRRHGLIRPKKPRRQLPTCPDTLHEPKAPNEVLCVDLGGRFRLGDHQYCYPFTATDQYSRFIGSCTALDSTHRQGVREAMEELFVTYGLPERIRSDNGPPFASRGLHGLSKLSVWWRLLGIEHERVAQGEPEQNSWQEQLRRTIKAQTARPAATNSLAQQERFDEFVHKFNGETPHEALGMKCPGDVYAPSSRPYPSVIPEPAYPLHDDVRRVSSGGHVRFGRRGTACFLSNALAGLLVGLREEDQDVWLVTFVDLDLGHYNLKTRQFTPNYG